MLTVSFVTRPMVPLGRKESSGEAGNGLKASVENANALSFRKSFREIRFAIFLILMSEFKVGKDVHIKIYSK
jgi:hypothetical protein